MLQIKGYCFEKQDDLSQKSYESENLDALNWPCVKVEYSKRKTLRNSSLSFAASPLSRKRFWKQARSLHDHFSFSIENNNAAKKSNVIPNRRRRVEKARRDESGKNRTNARCSISAKTLGLKCHLLETEQSRQNFVRCPFHAAKTDFVSLGKYFYRRDFAAVLGVI